jgi:hypothetical protein
MLRARALRCAYALSRVASRVYPHSWLQRCPLWLHSLCRPLPACSAHLGAGNRCGANECEPVYVNVDIGLWSNDALIQRIRCTRRGIQLQL